MTESMNFLRSVAEHLVRFYATRNDSWLLDSAPLKAKDKEQDEQDSEEEQSPAEEAEEARVPFLTAEGSFLPRS